MTGGLTRLESRTKSRKEEPVRARCALSSAEQQSCVEQHVLLVDALVEARRREHTQAVAHMQRLVYEEWLNTEIELTRERGLWGPPIGSRYDLLFLRIGYKLLV